jgi:alkaline phosphatase
VGGGRRKFMKTTDRDYKLINKFGDRIDNRNLIDEWSAKMASANKTYKFIWNITDFQQLEPNKYEHILGN